MAFSDDLRKNDHLWLLGSLTNGLGIGDHHQLESLEDRGSIFLVALLLPMTFVVLLGFAVVPIVAIPSGVGGSGGRCCRDAKATECGNGQIGVAAVATAVERYGTAAVRSVHDVVWVTHLPRCYFRSYVR